MLCVKWLYWEFCKYTYDAIFLLPNIDSINVKMYYGFFSNAQPEYAPATQLLCLLTNHISGKFTNYYKLLTMISSGDRTQWKKK